MSSPDPDQRRDRDAVAGLSDVQRAVIVKAAIILLEAATMIENLRGDYDIGPNPVSGICHESRAALLKLLAEGKVE